MTDGGCDMTDGGCDMTGGESWRGLLESACKYNYILNNRFLIGGN